ncbi:MAG: dinitrogenase iron-molybdenum cofactor biosynthesis domain-containing protein [Proteobacteria bacterium]|nr:dinitrogenase iron-molybdenum cofactor biosynthesis domain-containing protein [Pseudomonadota bacterium]MBU1582432.1 dinitrogenase iron-molybdenum cofactor biosynthesis domain-containing protein [Pseudomonadota bacterium]MBU2453770.1 dinitrogenase iron-molybdenum cofactor biosynthesis domain-containing protein [Pseudomonadota bacterium]
MKIALTVWGNRISPVFDSAQTLLIAQIKNNQVIKKSYESFDSNTAGFSDTLKKLDISVLICGAISEKPTNMIAVSGIKLIPFVTGNAEQVLDLYLSNKPVSSAYFMPGYRKLGCRNGLKNAGLNFEKI